MRNKFIILLIILSIISITFISLPVSAETATCTDEYEPQTYTPQTESNDCNTPLDWDYLFAGVNLDDGSTIADEENENYRLLFNEAGIIMNQDIQSEIRDEIYPYETHFNTDSQTHTIEDDSESQSIDFSYHNLFSSENSDAYKPDNLRAPAKIPGDSNITVNIYDSNNDYIKTTELTENRRDPDDLRMVSERIDIPEDRIDSEYNIDVELHASSEGVSPVISNHVVLYESIPLYRYEANSRSEYSDLLDSYHEHLYLNNYDERGHHSSDETKTTVYSPRLQEDRYESLDIESRLFENSIFDGINNDARVIRHGYVNIDTIEPSVKIPDENTGQSWEKLIGDEGDIYVIYDAAIGDVPDDDQDYTGSPSVDDLEWEYELNDIEFTATLYAEPETGQTEYIESKETTNDSGAIKFDYQEDEIPSDISEFIVEMEISISYLNESEQYYAPEKNCPSDNSDANESYSSYSPSGCSSPSDTYKDFDDLRTEHYDTKVEEENTKRITDEQEVRGIASEDGPSDDDFNVQIANYPDETRTYIERDADINNLDETRWTNIKAEGYTRSNTIDVTDNNPTDTISVEERNIADEFDIFNENNFRITDEMDVYISAWTSGDFGSDISNIDTIIEDEHITTSTYDEEYNDNTERYQISDYENITSSVIGNENINVSFEFEGELPENIENSDINYKITIDTNESMQKINSRWNYVNYRDSKWDSIEYIDEDCGTNVIFDDGCFDYVNEPPEQNNMMPVQTHLIPTTNSLETNLYSNPQYDVNINEMVEVYNTVNTPIESSYCPPHPEKDDRNICSVYQGYLANEDIEQNYRDGEYDIDTNRDYINEDMNSEERHKYLFDLEYSFDGLYDFIYDDGENEFEEPESFEVITDDPIQNLSIAGNASWEYSELSTDNIRNARSTNLEVEIIPREKLTEDYVEERNAEDVNNNQIKTKNELEEDEVQLKIKLTDSNREPINTWVRGTEETIYIERGGIYDDDEIGDIDFDIPGQEEGEDQYEVFNENDRRVGTNSEGLTYATVALTDENDEYTPVNIQFEAEEDWWEISEDERLLVSSSVNILGEENISLGQNQGDIESEYSMYDIISSIVFLIGFIFFIVAMFFRIHPNSQITTLDLFYTVTDSFREPIKTSIQYLIMVLIFCFILIVFLQFI